MNSFTYGGRFLLPVYDTWTTYSGHDRKVGVTWTCRNKILPFPLETNHLLLYSRFSEVRARDFFNV